LMLRPGAIMASHESDFASPPTMIPPSELSDKVQRWGLPQGDLMEGAPHMRMGARLFQLYQEAGLPAPELRMGARRGGGRDGPAYEYVAETLRSLLPMLQRVSGLDPDEVGIDTL